MRTLSTSLCRRIPGTSACLFKIKSSVLNLRKCLVSNGPLRPLIESLAGLFRDCTCAGIAVQVIDSPLIFYSYRNVNCRAPHTNRRWVEYGTALTQSISHSYRRAAALMATQSDGGRLRSVTPRDQAGVPKWGGAGTPVGSSSRAAMPAWPVYPLGSAPTAKSGHGVLGAR